MGVLGAIAQVDTSLAKHLSAQIIFRGNLDNYKLSSSYVGAKGSYSISQPTEAIFTNAKTLKLFSRTTLIEA